MVCILASVDYKDIMYFVYMSTLNLHLMKLETNVLLILHVFNRLT
jgi:hypothetical protein